MKILIIGQGGREHALAWKAAQSPQVTHVFVAPGNGGTALEPKVKNLALSYQQQDKLIDFAKKEHIDFTIVGPEAPLANGIVDHFHAHHLKCFGPNQQAAQLESSKKFAKDFMQRHHIPTAHYASFTDATAAKEYLQQSKFPIVIKASGLASGKGVIIAQNLVEANAAIAALMLENKYASAGQTIIIEDFLWGEEASYMVMVDGLHILPLATSQDHKTRDDGDRGPNTGGMGAYSPAPIITSDLEQKILQQIIQPTIAGLKSEGIIYTGFLYAGLMITPEGEIKVLEFNCRLGDPETQPILLRLKSDFAELIDKACHGQLNEVHLQWDPRPAVTVVLAAKGYPEHYPQDELISGLTNLTQPDVKVFHAGTVLRDQHLYTQGGRVLGVSALGDSFSQAQKKAYEIVSRISWQHLHYRKDIGHRAVSNSR